MCIDVDALDQCVRRCTTLQRLFTQMLETHWLQASQNAVCSHYHLLEARLARMLLRIGDQIGHDDFHLTHEMMAQALGVRRVGVTKAAMALQSRKLIYYTRGAISIVHRSGLANLACTCYEADQRRDQLIAANHADHAQCVQ